MQIYVHLLVFWGSSVAYYLRSFAATVVTLTNENHGPDLTARQTIAQSWIFRESSYCTPGNTLPKHDHKPYYSYLIIIVILTQR